MSRELMCEHLRLIDTCESCSHIRALERGVALPLVVAPAVHERRRADEDAYFDLPDTDVQRTIFVAKGDLVPRELDGVEGRPATHIRENTAAERSKAPRPAARVVVGELPVIEVEDATAVKRGRKT